jgi:hypothetical protein
MIYLIFNGSVVGVVQGDGEVSLPEGFEEIESDLNLPSDAVFFDGVAIAEKPIQPSPNHVWDGTIWVAPVPSLEYPRENDWAAFAQRLKGSEAWARVYAASSRTLRANSAFTLLLNTITSGFDTETLAFAIAQIRGAMDDIKTIGDFSESEIDSINEALSLSGFELRINHGNT